MKKIIKLCIAIIILISLCSCSVFDKKEDKASKEELTLEALKNPVDFYKYTGNPISIEKDVYFINKDGRRANGILFDYVYENNINPGTATAKITAKSDNEYFKGSVTYTFLIVPSDENVDVSSFIELKDALTNPKKRFVNVIEDITIPNDEAITIEKQINLSIIASKGTTLKNYGTINILEDGFLNVGGNEYTSKFYNYGTINSKGNIISLYNGKIFNTGVINNTGNIKIYSSLISNNEVSGVKLVDEKSVYRVRKDINKEIINFNNEIRYNEEIELNKNIVYVGDIYISSNQIEYFNYDKVGLVTGVINMDEDDPYFYGSTTFNYNLVKGTITVSTIEELIEKKNTHNFNTYILSPQSKNITINEPFIIDSDEEVIINSSLLINSSFINNLKLKMNDNNINILNSNTLTNNGNISFNKGGIDSNNGSLINGSKLNNDAKIEGRININNLTNYGVIECNDYIYFNNLINYGNIKSHSSFYINKDGSFLNEKDAVILIEGESAFRGNSFNNKGIIDNNNKMTILDSNDTLLNTGNILNRNGIIYAFEPIDGVVDNFILRKYLNETNTSIEYKNIIYDELAHSPKIYVDGVEVIAGMGLATSVRKKGATTSLSKSPTDVGTYSRYIKAIGDYNKYAGDLLLDYNIDYASIHVNSDSELKTKVNNKNYNLIILDKDIRYEGENELIISKNQTIDLNYHKLILLSKLTNNGKIIIRKVTDLDTFNKEDEISLLIGDNNKSNTPILNNYGIIENSGLIVVNVSINKKAKLLSFDSSNIINNGVIYTQDNELILDDLSTGLIYMRKQVGKEESNITLEYNETSYTGLEKTPIIKVYNDSLELDISDYNILYSNNINAGIAQVEIIVKSFFNEIYYGSAIKEFIINKSVKLLTNLDEELDGNNYYKFKLINDITSVNTVIVPEGTILDLDIYRIKSISRKIKFEEGATLEVAISNVEDYNKFIGVANKITLVSDIGSYDDDITLSIKSGNYLYSEDDIASYQIDKSMYANYIYIEDEKFNLYIDSTKYYAGKPVRTIAHRWFVINSNPIKEYEGLKLFNTVVDLNGYNILSNIKYMLDKDGFNLSDKFNLNFTFDNSSNIESKIGYEDNNSSSFEINGTQDYNSLTKFNFNNVTVCSLRLYINYLNGDVIINGVNSSFISNTKPALIIDGNIEGKTHVNSHFTTSFENSKFKSTSDTAVVIRSGTNNFDGCVISSTGSYSDISISPSNYKGCGVCVIQNANADTRNIVLSLGSSTVLSTNGYGIVEYISNYKYTDYTQITYDDSKVSGKLGKYYFYKS